jgi:hypothetical protein
MRMKHGDIVSKHWIKCSYCELQFQNKDTLMIHCFKLHNQFVNHLGGGSNKCTYCDQRSGSLKILYQHIRQKHPEEVKKTFWLVCSICQLTYPTKYVLRKHKLSHKRNSDCACQFCDIVYKTRLGMLRHSRKKHKQQLQLSWFQCSSCQIYFPEAVKLEYHQKSTPKCHQDSALKLSETVNNIDLDIIDQLCTWLN